MCTQGATTPLSWVLTNHAQTIFLIEFCHILPLKGQKCHAIVLATTYTGTKECPRISKPARPVLPSLQDPETRLCRMAMNGTRFKGATPFSIG